jgi:FixJ family two-component response regulator
MFNLYEQKIVQSSQNETGEEFGMNVQPVIFVVEDDKDLNHLIQKVLCREGHITEGAFNGKDAISRILQNSNALMLLDYSLPDMTGVRLFKTLKEKKCEIPFIVITGRGNEEIAVEMMKLGAKDYLIKGSNMLDMLPVVVRKTITEMENEKKLLEAEMLIHEKSYLNQIILDRMPCVTLLVQPYTREIIASNAAAVKLGAVSGGKCHQAWIKQDAPCPWCKAPLLWKSGEEQHHTFEALGKRWDAYWVPIDDNMYMHYAFDTSIHIADERSFP